MLRCVKPLTPRFWGHGESLTSGSSASRTRVLPQGSVAGPLAAFLLIQRADQVENSGQRWKFTFAAATHLNSSRRASWPLMVRRFAHQLGMASSPACRDSESRGSVQSLMQMRDLFANPHIPEAPSSRALWPPRTHRVPKEGRKGSEVGERVDFGRMHSPQFSSIVPCRPSHHDF